MYKTLVCNSISCPTALHCTASLRLLWNIDETLAFVASSDTLNICLMLVELEWSVQSYISSDFKGRKAVAVFLPRFSFFPSFTFLFLSLLFIFFISKQKFPRFPMVGFIKAKFLSGFQATEWALSFSMMPFVLLNPIGCLSHLQVFDAEINVPPTTHTHTGIHIHKEERKI